MTDAINAAFEVVGGLLSLLNLRALMRDKRVLGVSWPVVAFWSAWGFWNLFYYPSLDQWASFAGGVFLTASNTAWVVLAIYYSRKAKL